MIIKIVKRNNYYDILYLPDFLHTEICIILYFEINLLFMILSI